MKNTRKQNIFVLTTLAAAMTGAFAAMPAYADDEERAALTQPQNSVDAEVITVGRSSPQFGQYNGLNRSGAYGNANIQFRAGDAYTDNENGGTTRVTIIGTDLGLSDRSASAKYENQGSWSVGIGYDALTHVIGTTNGYQTPYGNGPGQNRFTLPSTFPTTGNNSNALTTSQLNSFGPQTISTTRDNYSINGSYIFNGQLTGTFDVNHLVQSGAKLLSTAAMNGVNGAANTAIQAIANPTNYQTDTVNAGLEWKGDGYRLALNYFGSFFRNAYDLSGVQFQPAMAGAANAGLQTMSTMPNNMMNQLALSGGYNFTEKSKLDGSFSWGVNTTSPGAAYDQAALLGATAVSVPDFNGLVNMIHGDLKYTDRSFKDLTLTALGKIDERDNLSSSNIYNATSVDGLSSPGVGKNAYNYPNTPMSWRKGLLEFAGDYKIDKNNTLRLALSNEQMRRWCNNYATGGNVLASGQVNYPQGTSCVTANNDSTNAVDLAYKLKASETVAFKLSGGYSMRQVDWNQNAVVAMIGTSNQNASLPAYMRLPAIPGINGGDYLGFQPYFEASRNQVKVKGSATWQALDNLGFNLTAQLTNDTYPNNAYGMQNGNSWSVNLDTNYNWSETGTAYAFAGYQSMNRVMQNYTFNATTTSMSGTWTNTENNLVTTVGVGAKEKGLMNGKLTVGADGIMSFANTNYQTGVNPVSTSTYNCAASNVMTCGNLPSITNNMYTLKTTGLYQVDKHSKVALMYSYNHLYSSDYYYNGMQTGYTPNAMLPTMQSNPSYAVNVVSARYIYDF